MTDFLLKFPLALNLGDRGAVDGMETTFIGVFILEFAIVNFNLNGPLKEG